MKKYLLSLINQVLDKRLTTERPIELPEGYNPLEQIRLSMYQTIPVPWNGKRVWCKLRCLNATQIRACGDYSNIVGKNDKNKELTEREIIEFRNYQEKLIRAVMVAPTYEEVEKMVDVEDTVLQGYKKQIEEIKKTDRSTLSSKEKADFQERLDALELFAGFILPEDTFGFLSSWANGNDISDVKKLTDDELLMAATLAKSGHDNPHDHISGVFTDANAKDIDLAAWGAYAEYMEKAEAVAKAKRGNKR